MFGLRRFGIKLDLETIQNLLRQLDNPQNSYSIIHVAGTNGKGSICSTLATILYLSGYKTGLYTSPHLVKFNERICVNNQPISDHSVAELCEIVRNLDYGEREPTFFEYTSAMAFYEFANQKVDWAVIETGMGGRMDATNVVMPKISIISNVSLEHQQYLGKTLKKIAGEKGGIIKQNIPVVTGVTQKSVISVLNEIAESKSAKLYRLGDQFNVQKKQNNTFNYHGIYHVWENLTTRLSGAYQIKNAALVLCACEILMTNYGVAITPETIREGLSKTKWPGRLEVVSEHPLVILDGAHNLAAARELSAYIKTELAGRQLTLVIGILDDKPYEAMLRLLVPHCQRLILTRPKIDRALPTEKLFNVSREILSDITVIEDVGEAVQYALQTALADDVICIAGSLYVVGEAKQQFEKKGISAFNLLT